MKKIIFVLAGAGAVVAVALFVFMSSGPGSDKNLALLIDTSKWKTYSNAGSKFEIKYPEEYLLTDKIKLGKKAERLGVYFYSKDQYSEAEKIFSGLPKFTVLAVDNAGSTPLDEWVLKNLGAGKLSTDEVRFGDASFLRVEGEGSIPFYFHLASMGNLIYMVSTPVYAEADPGIYSGVLASFKAI